MSIIKSVKFLKKETSFVFYKGNFICVTILKIIENINYNFLFFKNYNFFCKSKGKGFCGTIKKYGFSSNYRSHGNSKAHRKQGSIGMCQDPGRVIKGKKMPSRMGGNHLKIKNVKIIYFDKNKLIIKGSLPGSYNSNVYLYDLL
ncbi:large ribosomal subunit protein uL3 [Candidatus Vidania fulgoroideorum]